MSTLTTQDSAVAANEKLGLVDMANNLLNGRLQAFRADASGILDELVARGEGVEQQLKSSFKGKMMIEMNVPALLSRFGLGAAKREKRLNELSTKVDKLIDVVTKLTEATEAKQANKTAVKKPATRRKASTAKDSTKAATKTAADAAVAPKEASSSAKPTSRRRSNTNKAKKTVAAPVAGDKPKKAP